MSPRLWYIRGLQLFASDADLADRLQTIARVERWGHRAKIALHDEPREVRVLLSGQLELSDGRYDVVARLGRGDVFGEFGESDQAYMLRAYDDLLIATLPRDEFEDAAANALGSLQARVGVMRRRALAMPAASLLYSPPQRRVGSVLLHLAESFGSVEDDRGSLDFTPRNRSLAQLSGLADPTVSDIVDGFKRDRIVEIGRTKLVIPSIERMRQLAIG